MMLAQTWSAEQWTAMLTAIIVSVFAGTAGLIAAWRTGKTHAELQAPSNGKTNGALTEDTAYTLRYVADILADQFGRPPPPSMEQGLAERRAESHADPTTPTPGPPVKSTPPIDL